MVKFGDADDAWLFIGFDGDGNPQPDGAQNVRGTAHDIPDRKTCLGYRANVKSRMLGFSAFQLDYEGMWDFDDANAAGWFATALPEGHPHYPGHCHNSQSPLINHPMLRLETDHCGSLYGTGTYQSTVNVQGIAYGGATIIAKPGDPDHSSSIRGCIRRT